MLLVFMYHRISQTRFANDIQAFAAHLDYLSRHYSIVLPGDALNQGQLSVCLTFDDAYYDFYHYVFPLLKQLQIPAVLAVPVKYISEHSDHSTAQRLAASSMNSVDDTGYENHEAFCTWSELQEMADSNLVKIASHSYTHPNLIETGVDLAHEIIESKHYLQQRLQQDIDTFVYPYGKMNQPVHQLVSAHYQYGMRIGSALNRNWSEKQGLIYRIDADHFWPHGIQWSSKHTAKYLIKYLSNKIRNK